MAEVQEPQQPDTQIASWERPWSLDEMRDATDEWTLASDAGVTYFLYFLYFLCTKHSLVYFFLVVTSLKIILRKPYTKDQRFRK